MKAITLIQPWASLIAIGVKTVETRSWQTPYRGLLAIHAGKKIDAEAWYHLCGQPTTDWPFAGAPNPIYATVLAAGLVRAVVFPSGAIVAICELTDCRETRGRRIEYGPGPKYADWVHELSHADRLAGDFTPGRYGWFLQNVQPLIVPVPCRGSLGLWDVPGELQQGVMEHCLEVPA